MSTTLIQLAMKMLSCSQKELATKLAVSPTQITKWKKGEYMSFEMEEKIRTLLDIGDLEPNVILAFGTLEDAKKWHWVISFLAELANENAESGFDTAPLIDEIDLIITSLIDGLLELQYPIPSQFPADLEKYIGHQDWSSEFIDVIDDNEFFSMIYQIFQAFTDIYGFYAAYIAYLDQHISEDSEWFEAIMDIESNLLHLAMIKADTELEKLSKFYTFKNSLEKEYKKLLNTIKLKAFKLNIPLRAEIMHLIDDSHNEIGVEAEAESLGFNDNRLHPDIYMNELLVGMRLIHQVLPIIMNKLGIKDIEIDNHNLSKF